MGKASWVEQAGNGCRILVCSKDGRTAQLQSHGAHHWVYTHAAESGKIEGSEAEAKTHVEIILSLSEDKNPWNGMDYAGPSSHGSGCDECGAECGWRALTQVSVEKMTRCLCKDCVTRYEQRGVHFTKKAGI